MIHTVIVPGVGGSEAQHWQSWLQQLVSRFPRSTETLQSTRLKRMGCSVC